MYHLASNNKSNIFFYQLKSLRIARHHFKCNFCSIITHNDKSQLNSTWFFGYRFSYFPEHYQTDYCVPVYTSMIHLNLLDCKLPQLLHLSAQAVSAEGMLPAGSHETP